MAFVSLRLHGRLPIKWFEADSAILLLMPSKGNSCHDNSSKHTAMYTYGSHQDVTTVRQWYIGHVKGYFVHEGPERI